MAKELPYFKFEPSLWDSGKIQMCSLEAQGLFINVCSLYWARLGDLPEKLVIHKLCKGNANALQELCTEEVLHIHEGKVSIYFLDEQLNDFQRTSNERSKAAQKRWNKSTDKKQVNANALQDECKSNAIREDKSIVDKSKEDRDSLLVARKQKFALTLEPFSNKYPREMLVDFYNYWTEPNKSQTKFRQELEKTWDVARRLDTWARRDRSKVIHIGQPKKSKFETNVETFSSLLMPE